MDLGGKAGFKMALHRAGARWYFYVAHLWEPGWSIIDVTDAARPRFVRFIPGPPNTWTLQVQIAEGRMITALEKIPPIWSPPPDPALGNEEGFLIWDLADPENPKQIGHYRTGGDGTHRNYYAGGRYVHATVLPKGFDGHIYAIVDIADPVNPVEVSRWWRKGQWKAGGEGGVPFGTMLHGGAYVVGDRAYLPYSAGGFVILDISDVTKPRLVSDLPFSPPFQSFIAVHTAQPLPERKIAVVNSEAIAENCEEPLGYAGLVDLSDETKPRLMSLVQLPAPPPGAPFKNFCQRGGRFGQHNQHQHQFQDVLYRNDDLVFLTYFNAGLRIVDINDPLLPREVGYFIPPDPGERRAPQPNTHGKQYEYVLVDARGIKYLNDKKKGV
jgi:hypothetical protein